MAYARELNDWDPMAASYHDANINSYEHGPGVHLTPYASAPANSEYKLYVNQIPLELTEEGMKQIFNRYGETSGVMSLPGSAWGFVTYSSFREAETAIRELNGKPPLCLQVMFARQKENKATRKNVPLHGIPNIEPVLRPPPLLENQRRGYISPEHRPMHIRPLAQGLGRGKELVALARRSTAPPVGHPYQNTDDLLYPAVHDPNYFDLYEAAEPFAETNNMWARGRLRVSDDGTRYVTMGRGYTWYDLPTRHPRVHQQVRAVHEKRVAGLYEYGENQFTQQIGKCQNCAQTAAMRCQRCREFYCSRTCQETDWPRHKIECQTMPALEGGADSGSISVSSGEEAQQQMPKKQSIGRLRRPLTTPAPLKAPSTTPAPVPATSPMPEMPASIPASTSKPKDVENAPLPLQDNFKRNHSGIKKDVVDQNRTPNTGCWNPMKNGGNDQFPDNRDGQNRGPNPNQKFNSSNISQATPLNQDNGAKQAANQKVSMQGSFDKYSRSQNATNETRQLDGQMNRNFYDRGNAQQKNYQRVNDKVKDLDINNSETAKPARKPLCSDPDVSFHRASEVPETVPTKLPVKVSFHEPKSEPGVPGTSVAGVPRNAVENGVSKEVSVEIGTKIPPAAKKNIIELLEVNEEGCFEAHIPLGGNKAAVTICVVKIEEEYTKISSELTPECEKMPKSQSFAPKVGDFVCGKRLDDWVRGTVTSLGPPMRLAAADEGRVEVVTSLKPVPQGFTDLPTLGAICELTEGDFTLEAMAQYTFLVVKTNHDSNEGVEIVLFSPDSKQGKGFLKPWSPAPEQKGIPYATLASGTEVCVTSFRSHTVIFVRSLVPKDIETFNKITQEVARWSTQATKLTATPVEGEIVMAKFAADGNFYRAIVRKINNEKIIVSYIDFGNLESTSIENIRPISANLKEYPSCAARVVLKDVSKEIPMTKEVNEYLSVLAGSEKPLMCTFEGSPASDGVVLKAADGSSVNQKINELLTPSWKKEEDTTSVFMVGDLAVAELGAVGETVSVLALYSYGPLMHAMAPQDLELIQHITDVMTAQMAEYCNQLKENYIPRSGELCLAPYENAWYRAVCLDPSTSLTTATVNFIDFGNLEEIPHSDLRLITKDFTSTKTLASLCQVVGLGPVNEQGELPPAVGVRITELIPPNSTTLVKITKCIKPGEYEVELPEIKEILVKEGLLKL